MKKILILLTLSFLWIAATKGSDAEYWQQQVHYHIDVSLNTTDHTLTGHESLTYRNNSPDTLTFVWFHLYPNAFRDDRSVYAREMKANSSTRFLFSKAEERGYIEIRSLKANGNELQRNECPNDGTELNVVLDRPLPPGESVTFEIDFYVKIPAIFSRLGHVKRHYEITQWYPKIVVYDRFGWHPDGYHAIGEFYGDFGVFDVNITVPSDMVVAATGILVAPDAEKQWLEERAAEGKTLDSLRSENTQASRKQIQQIHNAIRERQASEETKTLQFHAEKVHDFAWCADNQFILKRGEFENIAINVYVLPRNEARWKDAVQYVADTFKYYGQWFMPFPYPQQSVVDGSLAAGGGMEYPMLTVISVKGDNYSRFLEQVIMHEVGHNWFYGILGTNEMAEAWLDEGMNTFAEARYMRTKYGKEGNLITWPPALRFLPVFGDDWLQNLLWYNNAANRAEVPVLTPACQIEMMRYPGTVYSKGGRILDMLQGLVGDEVFDRIMQSYFAEWQFKHPTTEDFRVVAERISGQELDWFFRQWLETTRTADYRVKSVRRELPVSGQEDIRRYRVQLENTGEIKMPVDVMVETRDGQKLTQRWENNEPQGDLFFETTALRYVTIDPDHSIPEVNKWNNHRPGRFRIKPLLDVPPFDEHLIFFYPTIWYDDDVDGWRTGVTFTGGNFRSFATMPGFKEWKLGTSYSIRSQKWNYAVSAGTYFSIKNSNYRFQADLSDLEGRVRSFVRLHRRFAASPFRDPSLNVDIGHQLTNLYNLDYWDHRVWSPGRVSSGVINLQYHSAGIQFRNSSALKMRLAEKVFGSDYNYSRFEANTSFFFQPSKSARAMWRFYSGFVAGSPARQDRFFLFGGNEPRGLFSPFVDGDGKFSPQDRIVIFRDGGGLRGYLGRFISGKYIATTNLDIKLPFFPVLFFADAGNVWSEKPTLSSLDWRFDAGASLSFGPVTFHCPFWVSDPAPGEKRLKYRWLISLSSNSLNLQF